MYSPHKHSYLHLRSSGVNPRIINRAVNLAREQPTIDPGDFEPPWNRLTSEQPCSPTKNVDSTRRPLAFGKLAIPKLCRELHSDDLEVVKAAITSFVDVLHDPEKGYQALRIRVPDRMADLLVHDEPDIRERTCMALTIVSGLADGKAAIAQNKTILGNLSCLLNDSEAAVRLKAAECLYMLSEFWPIADELIEFGYVPILLNHVCEDIEEVATIHLHTLDALMYGYEGVEHALEHNGFEIFCSMIDGDLASLKASSLKCLSKLLATPHGKQMAYDADLLDDLNRLLHYEESDVYGASASAIMFATIKSAAKIKAIQLKRLPHRLVKLCHDSEHPLTKLQCIQALTNICEHPQTRQLVCGTYYDTLENLQVGDEEELIAAHNNLMKGLNWTPQQG
ncbi:rtdr1 [Holotrichia oblita]|uniref:Rtdr1 n=1 Tax=Holotrichia oblita TaxID=644536 RepID=A0ACB9SXQ5_HOLOL|nr:rtdr1 [Holotrichia oblita]